MHFNQNTEYTNDQNPPEPPFLQSLDIQAHSPLPTYSTYHLPRAATRSHLAFGQRQSEHVYLYVAGPGTGTQAEYTVTGLLLRAGEDPICVVKTKQMIRGGGVLNLVLRLIPH
jgi:hypothetical protein